MHALLSRLFDDAAASVAVISAFDGSVEYVNHGAFLRVDGITEIRNTDSVDIDAALPPEHPVHLTRRDGQPHAAPSTWQEGAWAVAALLPGPAEEGRGLIFLGHYVGTEEEVWVRHRRDCSRAMLVLEFQAVAQALDIINDCVVTAKERTRRMVAELTGRTETPAYGVDDKNGLP